MKRFKSTTSLGLVMAFVLVVFGIASFTSISTRVLASEGITPPTPVEIPTDSSGFPNVGTQSPSPFGELFEITVTVIGAII